MSTPSSKGWHGGIQPLDRLFCLRGRPVNSKAHRNQQRTVRNARNPRILQKWAEEQVIHSLKQKYIGA